jgi:hypothetical protein
MKCERPNSRMDGQKQEERRRITTIRDKKGRQRQDRRGGGLQALENVKVRDGMRKGTITTDNRMEGRTTRWERRV